jgi:2-polyprenyl-3-methyl-5-hydroxy-6-metoxy-1,4-benzoquinol methylase
VPSWDGVFPAASRRIAPHVDFERHKANWEALGQLDPLWAILSESSKKGGGWRIDEFFAGGRGVVGWVARHLGRIGVMPALDRALDFGCGLGRLTQPLCEHFHEVVGIDVASSMIDAAQRHNRHGERCRYLVNSDPDLRQFESDSFDFVLSLIVLQHMMPEFSKGYLLEFLRVLRPGGVMFFQIPASPRDPTRKSEYRPAAKPRIEMYGVPQAEVVALLAGHGAEILDMAADEWAGKNWHSVHYTVRKPAR